MSASPESVVRDFLAVWADPRPEVLANFFDEDATWVDGPQGVRRGAVEIVDELAKQLAISHPMTVEVRTLVADGATVMAEWRDDWMMSGKAISTTVMAVFEIADGRIKEWRESYDLSSVVDQIVAATSDG